MLAEARETIEAWRHDYNRDSYYAHLAMSLIKGGLLVRVMSRRGHCGLAGRVARFGVRLQSRWLFG